MGSGQSTGKSYKPSFFKSSSTAAQSSSSKATPSAPPRASHAHVDSHIAFDESGYKGAPLPNNEAERHAYLTSLNTLDTVPEKRFDDITKLACMIFKVPIALVSLVDSDRQWFKSVQGLDTDHTDRKSSFCAWTLLPEHPEVLVVEDATKDARFMNNMLVTGPPDIRFYAGCPLVGSNRLRLGSLCVIDRTPRHFEPDQCMMLANLAEMVVRELEKEVLLKMQAAKSAQLTQENTHLLRAIDAFSEGIVLCNVSEMGWPIEFINDAWESLTGYRKENLGKGFWEFFEVPANQTDRVISSYTTAIGEQAAFELSVSFQDPTSGVKRWLTLQMRCANAENMDLYMPLVGIPTMLTAESEGGGHTEDKGPIYYFATLLPHQVADTQVNSGSNSSSAVNIVSSSNNVSSGKNVFVLADSKIDPFNDVKLGQLLGRGSFGRVYRGAWNGAQVAVKVLEYNSGESEKQGMEALLSSQLSHPNVVQTYKHCTREVGHANGGDDAMLETWMVMEFCNKGSLSDAVDKGWFRQKGALFEADFAALITTAKEVASAMLYLHKINILHGDLNGNNVLLSSSDKDARKWTVKVADFGLSRLLDSTDSIETATFGTVTHMPPELLMDGKMARPADVYAFGVIMWELYMGQKPWSGLGHGQIVHNVGMGKQLQLSSSCPSDLKKFIMKCMATQPEARPTFDQVLKDLESLEEDLVGM